MTDTSAELYVKLMEEDPALARLCGLLERVDVEKGLQIEVTREPPNYFLRLSAPDGRCNVTGDPLPWTGRKWRLSQHMTDGEVVATAFKAYLTVLEHEAREVFLFDGQPVFNSHVDIHQMVQLHASGKALKGRSPVSEAKERSPECNHEFVSTPGSPGHGLYCTKCDLPLRHLMT